MSPKDDAINLSHSDELLTEDLAGTHRREAREFPIEYPSDEQLNVYDREGFLVLKNLLSAQQVDAIGDALRALLGPPGRNNFEGFNTKRAYAVLAKTRVADALAAHPLIMGFLSERLHPEPLLSTCQAISIGPGESEQLAHFDDGYYHAPRPGRAHGLSVIWAIDPFTEANGATRIWPGSHRWDKGRDPQASDPMTFATMEPGDAIVFHSTLWHGGGANQTEDWRLGLTCQYCLPWLRTQENMSLAVPPALVASLDAPLPSLLGYQVHPPFIGHVNGVHPKSVLEAARRQGG